MSAAEFSEIRHPIFARLFDRMSRKVNDGEQREHRQQLLRGVRGRVLEVGAGNGLNFEHYPEAVTEVVAVEPEPYLLTRALEAARTAPVPIRVMPGRAEALPVEDASFDSAVVSLVLCSVRDPRQALQEIRRALRAGGELRFYEHVVSPTATLARRQRRADHIWPHIGGGCHASRDTLASIEEAGFDIQSIERFVYSPVRFSKLTSPHILGRALRSAE